MAGIGANLVLLLAFTGLAFFPLEDKPDPTIPDRTTNVRIVVGTDDSGLRDDHGLKGTMPGAPDSIFIAGRNDIQITADKDVGGISPEYVAIVAGKDPVCIAWITVTTPTAQKYSFVGDIASQELCNLPFYYQNEVIACTDNKGITPMCIWVGGNSGYEAFGYHITDFVGNEERANQYVKNLDILCKSRPRFWTYPKFDIEDCLPYFPNKLEYEDTSFKDKDFSKVLIPGAVRDKCGYPPAPPDENYAPGITYRQRFKREVGNSTQEEPIPDSNHNFNGRLVVTTSDQHGASQLCNSDRSMGPDLVSQYEKLFCDMENKKLYPLCNGVNSTETCFDMDLNTLSVGTGLVSRGEILSRKEYHTVSNW